MFDWKRIGRGLAAIFGVGLLAGAAQAQSLVPPMLVPGDEPVVVTQHTLHTARGVLNYEARAGRIPIRNDETGEVHGYVFFVAYVVKPPAGKTRPLMVAWNGGPTGPAIIVHSELLGPRRLEGGKFVDNAESLLYTTDLVFMDPVSTGFSRPAKPEYDKEFLSTLGDFAMTTEFVRAYQLRFGAEHQPLILFGESYGTWRVNGTVEMLTKKGIKVSGAVLLSGGVPGSLMPPQFQDAMYVPARTATAFELKKLAPDLMKDKQATLKAVDDWSYNIYMPALAKVDTMTPAEKDKIVNDLAHFTGVKPEQIDHKTLVMTNNAFKAGLYEGDKSKVLNTYDMRIVGRETENPGRRVAISDYLRGELGYRTDLAYTGEEDGYMPVPGPARKSTASRWVYNHTEITPDVIARMNAGGGPPLSQPWLQNAMRADPGIKIFVAAGRYDSLNMCEGNVRMIDKLEPALVQRFSPHCYEGGHMMYRVESTRLALTRDLEQFIATATK